MRVLQCINFLECFKGIVPRFRINSNPTLSLRHFRHKNLKPFKTEAYDSSFDLDKRRPEFELKRLWVVQILTNFEAHRTQRSS